MRRFIFILSEIIIGILLLSLLLFAGIDKIRIHLNSFPSYTVIFNDVDGLGVGSPVRLMGIQAGNVTKLELFDSEIYVTFKITEKNTTIPDGSIASISFTGLGGSKFLEITPAKKKLSSNTKIIYSKEPIRINSVMQVQTTIFENLLEFCRGILGFFSKNSIESTKENLKNTSEYMQESNLNMNDTLKNINKSGSDIAKNTKEIKLFLNEQNKNINSAYKSLNELATDKDLKNNINTVQKTVENLSSSIDTKKADEKVSEVTNNLNKFNSDVKKFNQNINKVKNREVEYISNINDSIQKNTDKLQGFIDSAKVKFKSDNQENKNQFSSMTSTVKSP